MTDTGKPQLSHRIVTVLPITLRGVSGFISALTSSVITVIFSFTIYQAVLKSELGYPDPIKILIMVIGPLISSFQFINITSTLAAMFSGVPKQEVGENTDSNALPVETLKVHQSEPDVQSLEREMYGDVSVILRSIAGFICCSVICFASITFTYVIHLGVMAGKPFPTNLEMVVVICGPIITSWTFMKAETTIKELMKIETWSDKFKSGVIKLLSK